MMHIVGVIGAGHCDATIARLAEEVGELLARRGLIVLTLSEIALALKMG